MYIGKIFKSHFSKPSEKDTGNSDLLFSFISYIHNVKQYCLSNYCANFSRISPTASVGFVKQIVIKWLEPVDQDGWHTDVYFIGP